MQLVSIDKDIRYSLSDLGQPQLASKDLVVRYLNEAPTVAAIRTAVPDEIEPERQYSISLTFSSDGEWVWSAVTAYYVEQYDVRLPEPFVQWILKEKAPPASLPDNIYDDAMALAHSSLV